MARRLVLGVQKAVVWPLHDIFQIFLPGYLHINTFTRLHVYTLTRLHINHLMQRIDSLYIAPSPLGGRGVFTAAPIAEGALIEVCPVIVLPGDDRLHIDETGLYNYYFIWGEADELCAIALGYGSLYNHSFEPNAEYHAELAGQELDFYALRDIGAGEEITVNYNGDPNNQEKLWFNTRQLNRWPDENA